MKLVSVIIPTYNNEKGVYQSLESVFKQTYKNIEIIVCDDHSNDFDCDRINFFIKSNKKENIKNYIVYTSIQNVGTVRNLDTAISKSSGEIIMILSSDDSFFGNFVIEKVVSKFEETKCKIMCCSRAFYKDDISDFKINPSNNAIKKFCKYDTAMKQYRGIGLNKLSGFASGSALYFTKSFYNDVGRYDKEYKLREDGPFLAKVTRCGNLITMAYDIVSIYYKLGGISNGKVVNKDIINDYRRFYRKEFLNYSELFSKKQLKRINYLDLYMKGGFKLKLYHIKYTFAFLGILIEKIKDKF